ncbi:DUF4400 domain-containing protein [Comamonas thiooxydans]|uniref:DUF4400 domain-containing protein n=1 Tax=Comamonas thiooxydans TaxID=363952 RepID=UPI00050FA0C1|nr:DUF4400 domain-containing protein [Comamonas thiooxydans]KGH23026.1 hypothetical protein P606_13410 [Comamonas thiooxydans]
MSVIHIRFWFFMIALMFLLGPLFRTPEDMKSYVRSEVQVTMNSLGDVWGGKIVSKSVDLFKLAPVQITANIFRSGEIDIEKASKENFVYKSWGTQIAMEFANKMMGGWGALLFIMSIRVMIMLSWFVLLAPMLVAACVDGISMRKIKFYNFKSVRPATYTLLSFFIIPFALGPFVYLVVPFSVSPASIPLITSMMLLPVAMLMANTQPLFGEK